MCWWVWLVVVYGLAHRGCRGGACGEKDGT
jgi:hypothetical protein